MLRMQVFLKALKSALENSFQDNSDAFCGPIQFFQKNINVLSKSILHTQKLFQVMVIIH